MNVNNGVLILNEKTAAEIVRKELAGWIGWPGAAADAHGWRCYHVDRYGECDCLDEMVSGVMLALTGEEPTSASEES